MTGMHNCSGGLHAASASPVYLGSRDGLEATALFVLSRRKKGQAHPSAPDVLRKHRRYQIQRIAGM
jgi:hypothetical protein